MRVAPDERGVILRTSSLTHSLRLIDACDFEIETFAGLVTARLRADPGFIAVQTIPGVGPTLGPVFVAEIGAIGRFPLDNRTSAT